MRLLRRVARAPALHFLLLGGVLLALGGAGQRPVATPGPAAAPAGAPADDELLLGEALAHGLDRDDPAVRERLARLARFVNEGPLEDEAALARAATGLGLERTDLVVRRHLVRTMRLALGALPPAELPDDAALARHLAAHADAYRVPARTRLTHVFLAAARRGTRVRADAETLLGRLRREAIAPAAAAALGDPCIAGTTVGPATDAEVARTFGVAFAGAVAAAPLAAWTGPIRSTWGLHLVWVHARTPAGVPPLEAVRGRVLQAVLAERRTARLRERLVALRARHAVGAAPAGG